MKCFERLTIEAHANQPSCLTDDAITTMLYLAPIHLDKKYTFCESNVIDFGSAFNTIISHNLLGKVRQQVLNASLCN